MESVDPWGIAPVPEYVAPPSEDSKIPVDDWKVRESKVE
jgi:hypothetical protein